MSFLLYISSAVPLGICEKRLVWIDGRRKTLLWSCFVVLPLKVPSQLMKGFCVSLSAERKPAVLSE